MTPQQVFKNLAQTAIAWRNTKEVFVKLSDSRSSKPADVDRARRNHLEAVKKHEAAIAEFEKLMLAGPGKKKKPIPWKALLDGAVAIGGALKTATDAPRIPNNVIDVEAEVVK